MNDADRRLLMWLNEQINTGKRTIVVPASLLDNTTEDGRTEARRLTKLAGCLLAIHV